MADLLINGKQADNEWGVHMGSGFLNALFAPSEAKEYITNEVRDEHGTRYVVPLGAPYLKERTIQLSFVLIGTTPSDFWAKKTDFLQTLYKGAITISVPPVADDVVFRLYYTGQGSSWKVNKSRTLATITLKFVEPNPNNRIL